jgi:hypothetical protein
MNKKTYKLTIIPIILATLLITILSNFKFANYDKYFIFPITILIITFIYLLNKQKLIINKKGYFYLIPLSLIILGTFFLKTNINNLVLNVIILPILLSMMFFTLTNKNYFLNGKFLSWTGRLFPEGLFSNLKVIKENTDEKNKDKKKIKNIILGIIISIPFVFIILLLLASADDYFNAFIEKIFGNIDEILDFKFIKNNILVLGISFITFFSTFINIHKHKETKVTIGEKKKIEPTIINTILIAINFVFLLFIVSEISRLTGNFLDLPAKYTYASYAREGFFQLLLVTIINFSIIFYILYKTNGIKENKLLKYLVLLVITFTIILIFNSYYRMYMYMHTFGFTVLRCQVILFLLMELIISLIMIKKIISNLKHKDAYILFYIMITTYIINIFTCHITLMNYLNHLINK